MTETYRTTELDNARKELATARQRMDAQTEWNARKREAAEQVEFWGNKVAFLNAVRGEA